MLQPIIYEELALFKPDFYEEMYMIAQGKHGKICAKGQSKINYRGNIFESVEMLFSKHGNSAIEDFDEWKFMKKKKWVIYKNGEWLHSFFFSSRITKSKQIQVLIMTENKAIQILRHYRTYEICKVFTESERRETWDEIVARNKNMHIKAYPELGEEINEIYKNYVRTRKILPSMRSMQFGGKPVEKLAQIGFITALICLLTPILLF